MAGLGRMLATVVLGYGAVFCTVRVLGKKQISSLTFRDAVSAFAIGELAVHGIYDRQTPILHWVLAIFTWGALTLLLDWLALKWRPLRRVLQGRPAILIANGQIQESELRRTRMNLDLLRSELRAQGAFTIAEVAWAILEPNGKVTVQKTAQAQTPKRSDLQLPSLPVGPSVAMLVEGEPSLKALRELGLTPEWLMTELAKSGETDLPSLLYVDRNPDGTITIQKRQQKGSPLTTLG